MEQITLNEKINTGDGIERISIIIHINEQKTWADCFLTVKLPTDKSASKGARKYIINPHTSLPILKLNTQRQNTPVSAQSIGAFCAEYDRFILFTAYKGHTQSNMQPQRDCDYRIGVVGTEDGGGVQVLWQEVVDVRCEQKPECAVGGSVSITEHWNQVC